jgi:hypothetical protein
MLVETLWRSLWLGQPGSGKDAAIADAPLTRVLSRRPGEIWDALVTETTDEGMGSMVPPSVTVLIALAL